MHPGRQVSLAVARCHVRMSVLREILSPWGNFHASRLGKFPGREIHFLKLVISVLCMYIVYIIIKTNNNTALISTDRPKIIQSHSFLIIFLQVQILTI